MLAPHIEAFLQFRELVKESAVKSGNKDLLKACDDIRDNTMCSLGVRVTDNSLSSINEEGGGKSYKWSLESADSLMKEKKQKERKEVEGQLTKVEKSLGTELKPGPKIVDLNRFKENTKYKSKEEWYLNEWKKGTDKETQDRHLLEEWSEKRDQTGLPIELKDGTPIPKGQLKAIGKGVNKYWDSRNKLLTKMGIANKSEEEIQQAINKEIETQEAAIQELRDRVHELEKQLEAL